MATHFRSISQKQSVFADSVNFSVNAGSANTCLVTLSFKDGDGNAMTRPQHFVVYLSDSALGTGLTATTASGNVIVGANGFDLSDTTAKKVKSVVTDSNGIYQLSITDTAKTGFYIACFIPSINKQAVSAQLTTANYG